jgi:hypothetical protein
MTARDPNLEAYFERIEKKVARIGGEDEQGAEGTRFQLAPSTEKMINELKRETDVIFTALPKHERY